MTGPVLAPDGTALDQVRLRGLRAHGRHGVLPHERAHGQPFLADVVLHLDTRAAAATDDLAATVSYADVAADVVAVLAGPPVDLLETLAQRVADTALGRPGVHAVDVTVRKPHAPLTVAFDDVAVRVRRHARPVALTRRPAAPVPAVLALGGNLGDPAAALRAAVAALRTAAGVTVTAVSPLVRTAPVLAPGQPRQPDYLNAVVLLATTLAPVELLDLAHVLEDAAGRTRAERWGPRTLDVDVVSVADLVVADPGLTLPHPRAHARAFVLVPWAAADPAAVLRGPRGGPVAELAAAVADQDVAPVAADWAGPGEG
ncbi:2-amino-4-hydroxy-6-hydroxymethyldihydropteridine diphosphokinase [Georgenia sp. TF02-10]|uniref:2-amino-4-hydroxy-6- hydroxymethyldihydropteridine diphosphokinase n=1 Tax=Georgenia sp. TF02-10 TaxID=2917725 RepID=UPI001FA7DCC8|nr:2-amino-4-hydroxy-6-hydroxymethyldihydropteridine diphosphokinase [Georgenia sp. TF02-10]UNX54483.1 2-amino-4-hydroxy-6-hydroxymethyldihydropteridine diphosphokinase [Georgenia sp. TF02-10]